MPLIIREMLKKYLRKKADNTFLHILGFFFFELDLFSEHQIL